MLRSLRPLQFKLPCCNKVYRCILILFRLLPSHFDRSVIFNENDTISRASRNGLIMTDFSTTNVIMLKYKSCRLPTFRPCSWLVSCIHRRFLICALELLKKHILNTSYEHFSNRIQQNSRCLTLILFYYHISIILFFPP